MTAVSVNRSAPVLPCALSNGRSAAAANGQASKTRGRNGREQGPALPATPALSISRPPRTPTPHGLRIAAIDIGTNSLHMVIVEVTDSLSFKMLSSDKDLTQLGSAALVHHRLTKRAMAHTMEVLARYQHIAHNLDCDVILAYATSAVRESVNGGDFVLAVKKQLGLLIQVISAQEEAHLIYLAVRQAIDLSSHATGTGPSLIVDIGGGSCELIVGTNAKPLLLESFKLGASRLTQQFVHSDPISGTTWTTWKNTSAKTLKPTIEAIREHKPQRVIGTSGTMENLAAMCVLQHGEEVRAPPAADADDTRGFRGGLQTAAPAAARRTPPSPGPRSRPRRPDHRRRGAGRLPLRQAGHPQHRCVRPGAARRDDHRLHADALAQGQALGADPRPAPRSRSLNWAAAATSMKSTACRWPSWRSLLFDQLAALHKLGVPANASCWNMPRCCTTSAGTSATSSHHKHSLYLIKNGDLEGFSPNELDIIANVARYHRKSMPKKSHPDYVALDPAGRELVWKLASILRIADALDRGHYANITSLRTISRENSVSILAHDPADPQLELWAARLKGDMFRTTFDRQLHFTAAIQGSAAARAGVSQG